LVERERERGGSFLLQVLRNIITSKSNCCCCQQCSTHCLSCTASHRLLSAVQYALSIVYRLTPVAVSTAVPTVYRVPPHTGRCQQCSTHCLSCTASHRLLSALQYTLSIVYRLTPVAVSTAVPTVYRVPPHTSCCQQCSTYCLSCTASHQLLTPPTGATQPTLQTERLQTQTNCSAHSLCFSYNSLQLGR